MTSKAAPVPITDVDEFVKVANDMVIHRDNLRLLLKQAHDELSAGQITGLPETFADCLKSARVLDTNLKRIKASEYAIYVEDTQKKISLEIKGTRTKKIE